MEIFQTTNGFICQILLGYGFEPLIVEYIQHLRMKMIFKITPESENLLEKLSIKDSFNQKKMIKGFKLYHLLLRCAQTEIENEEKSWYVKKLF